MCVSLSRVGWRRVRGHRAAFSRRAHGRVPCGQPCHRAWPVEPHGLGRGRPQRAVDPMPCCPARFAAKSLLLPPAPSHASAVVVSATTASHRDPAAALHVARHDAIAVAIAVVVVVSLPHSRLLIVSRCSLLGPVGCRPHVVVHAAVALSIMTLLPRGPHRSDVCTHCPWH